MRERIADTLIAIGNEITKTVDCINEGGCGVYASLLAAKLREIHVFDFKITLFGYQNANEINVSEVEDEVRANHDVSNFWDWQKHDVPFNHVMIEWDGYLWDSTGKKKCRGDGNDRWRMDKRHPGDISLDALEQLAAIPKNWNRTFPRRTGIPKMKKVFDKHFKMLQQALTFGF